MKKILAYVFIVLGLIGIAFSIGPLNEVVVELLPFLSSVKSYFISIIGVSFIVMGVILLRFYSPRQPKVSEVPIYAGKNVVGFRRMGKK